MSIKCKAFEHHISRIHYLERQINDFIDESGAEVVTATQACDANGNVAIIIWYREPMSPRQPPEEVL